MSVASGDWRDDFNVSVREGVGNLPAQGRTPAAEAEFNAGRPRADFTDFTGRDSFIAHRRANPAMRGPAPLQVGFTT
jgi:hypothetical protein